VNNLLKAAENIMQLRVFYILILLREQVVHTVFANAEHFTISVCY
jgi:hypothetical protein